MEFPGDTEAAGSGRTTSLRLPSKSVSKIDTNFNPTALGLMSVLSQAGWENFKGTDQSGSKLPGCQLWGSHPVMRKSLQVQDLRAESDCSSFYRKRNWRSSVSTLPFVIESWTFTKASTWPVLGPSLLIMASQWILTHSLRQVLVFSHFILRLRELSILLKPRQKFEVWWLGLTVLPNRSEMAGPRTHVLFVCWFKAKASCFPWRLADGTGKKQILYD